jgi:vacuolar-type H+-ATPase subunit E/Vma4
MQREPENFGDQELALIYIAKKLNEALRLEKLLTDAGLDYLVEPDKYSGGIIFQSERVGAFFYVAPGDETLAKDTLKRNGFKPYIVE